MGLDKATQHDAIRRISLSSASTSPAILRMAISKLSVEYLAQVSHRPTRPRSVALHLGATRPHPAAAETEEEAE
jgi:hypothetical protein